MKYDRLSSNSSLETQQLVSSFLNRHSPIYHQFALLLLYTFSLSPHFSSLLLAELHTFAVFYYLLLRHVLRYERYTQFDIQ